MRAAGLSGRKAAYVLDLAQAVENGGFDPEVLTAQSDEAVTALITGLRGFGRWSADIYLMFALGRGDIMPAEDLAMRVGYQRLKGLDEAPEAKTLRQLTSNWSPWRSAGALVLWQVYGARTLD